MDFGNIVTPPTSTLAMFMDLDFRITILYLITLTYLCKRIVFFLFIIIVFIIYFVLYLVYIYYCDKIFMYYLSFYFLNLSFIRCILNCIHYFQLYLFSLTGYLIIFQSMSYVLNFVLIYTVADDLNLFTCTSYFVNLNFTDDLNYSTLMFYIFNFTYTVDKFFVIVKVAFLYDLNVHYFVKISTCFISFSYDLNAHYFVQIFTCFILPRFSPFVVRMYRGYLNRLVNHVCS